MCDITNNQSIRNIRNHINTFRRIEENKPIIIVVNKCDDLIDIDDALANLNGNIRVISISCANNWRVEDVLPMFNF